MALRTAWILMCCLVSCGNTTNFLMVKTTQQPGITSSKTTSGVADLDCHVVCRRWTDARR
jgi:hypothetical protein